MINTVKLQLVFFNHVSRGLMHWTTLKLRPKKGNAESNKSSSINTKLNKWREPPSKKLRQDLANLCVGYCGADLKARLGTAQDALLDTKAWGLARTPSAPLPWQALLSGSQTQQADFR